MNVFSLNFFSGDARQSNLNCFGECPFLVNPLRDSRRRGGSGDGVQMLLYVVFENEEHVFYRVYKEGRERVSLPSL